MTLAAVTTLVAALWMISLCNSSVDCSAPSRNLATELDGSSEGEEILYFVIDVASCANSTGKIPKA